MGLAIFLSGIFFYIFRDSVSRYIHYILPVPPIGVAAYVFVFNLYVKFGGNLPTGMRPLAKEVVLATVASAVVFLICSLLILAATEIVRNSLNT